MADKAMIGVRAICAVEAQYGTIHSIVWLTIQTIVGDVFSKDFDAGYVQKIAMRAFIHVKMTKFVFNALLE